MEAENLGFVREALMMALVLSAPVLGAGLLVGLILPAMTRGRKRNDRWF